MIDEPKSSVVWTHNKLEIKNKILSYYSHIDGDKPFFFFLHGITDNGLCYDRIATNFLKEFNVILPDARGHGRSSDPPKKSSFKDMAEDIYDICEHLHLDKIFILGHSMGGAQAALFAAEYPDRVKAVILEDPAIINNRFLKIMMRLIHPFLIIIPHKKTPGSLDHYIKKSRKINKKWCEHDQLVWAQAQQEFASHYLRKAVQMIVRNIPLWKEIFPKIRAPILLLTSQNGIIRKSTAAKLKNQKSDLNWVYIPEAGHNIRREQYDLEIKAIKEFLSKNKF